MRVLPVTRKGLLEALDVATVWGKHHYGQQAPPSKPDQMAFPPTPVVALFMQDKVPNDDVRADYKFQVCKRIEGAVWIVKTGEPRIRDFLSSERIEFLEWDTIPYWKPHAAEWRDVEMRYYADVVLEYKNPPKPKKRRKGRKVE